MAQVTIGDLHSVMLGRDPTEDQKKLYTHPICRGYSNRDRDEMQAEACILRAVTLGDDRNRPVILTPPSLESWVLDRVSVTAVASFEQCKALDNAVAMVRGYAELFKRLLLNTRPLQLPQEPQYWVAIGFHASDPLPTWLAQKLL